MDLIFLCVVYSVLAASYLRLSNGVTPFPYCFVRHYWQFDTRSYQRSHNYASRTLRSVRVVAVEMPHANNGRHQYDSFDCDIVIFLPHELELFYRVPKYLRILKIKSSYFCYCRHTQMDSHESEFKKNVIVAIISINISVFVWTKTCMQGLKGILVL